MVCVGEESSGCNHHRLLWSAADVLCAEKMAVVKIMRDVWGINESLLDSSFVALENVI